MRYFPIKPTKFDIDYFKLNDIKINNFWKDLYEYDGKKSTTKRKKRK